jgi:hypothetical protein
MNGFDSGCCGAANTGREICDMSTLHFSPAYRPNCERNH